jgi:hypothetical protein
MNFKDRCVNSKCFFKADCLPRERLTSKIIDYYQTVAVSIFWVAKNYAKSNKFRKIDVSMVDYFSKLTVIALRRIILRQ